LGAATVLDVPSAYEYYVDMAREEGVPCDEERRASEAAYIRDERRVADWLFAPSDYVIQCLRENGVSASRIVKIPYGVDPDRFIPDGAQPRAWRRSGEPFRALFVGRIDFRKGARYLLEAWQSLDLPSSELVLAGGADEAELERLSRCRGNWRWVGNIPWTEVHRLFQSADVFVFPSLAEGSALVTYEAMAAGLPVITTPNAGAVVRDGEDGFLVPIRTPAAIADRLSWLYEHPRERAAMGQRARQRILEQYTWRHYRARVARAYQAIHDGEPVQDAVDALNEQIVAR
jgi:glycosyltransferase involved in cell wall biosynthesis